MLTAGNQFPAWRTRERKARRIEETERETDPARKNPSRARRAFEFDLAEIAAEYRTR